MFKENIYVISIQREEMSLESIGKVTRYDFAHGSAPNIGAYVDEEHQLMNACVAHLPDFLVPDKHMEMDTSLPICDGYDDWAKDLPDASEKAERMLAEERQWHAQIQLI